MPEWERFGLSLASAWRGELTTVRHIVHVPPSRRIAEDGRIRAGLIYDESRLNRSRISVAWVSANTWAYKSIYGTVEFQFDWKDILGNKGIYWVEAMPYSPAAYRFLLTERSVPSRLAVPYDPLSDDGPLQFSGGKWYWNAKFTSEFMVEEDLRLTRTTGLDFVNHHPKICRVSSLCQDRRSNPQPQTTGGRMLSFILGHDIHSLDAHLRPSQDSPTNRHDLLDTALAGIELELIINEQFQFPRSFVGTRPAKMWFKGPSLYTVWTGRKPPETCFHLSRRGRIAKRLLQRLSATILTYRDGPLCRINFSSKSGRAVPRPRSANTRSSRKRSSPR